MPPPSSQAVRNDSVSQYPTGHYGSLTVQQQDALDSFRSLLAKREYPDFEKSTPAQDVKLL